MHEVGSLDPRNVTVRVMRFCLKTRDSQAAGSDAPSYGMGLRGVWSGLGSCRTCRPTAPILRAWGFISELEITRRTYL